MTKKSNQLSEYNGILIIPIKKHEPVIVFKMHANPFVVTDVDGDYHEGTLSVVPVFDYNVYWQGKLLGQHIPSIVRQQYDDYFDNAIKESVHYDIEDLPKSVIELPLSYIMNDRKIKILSPEYATPARNALRALGMVKETRGKASKKDAIMKERDKFIIKQYKSIKKKKPLPIAIIELKLGGFVSALSPDDERVSVYSCCHTTIRRVLKNFIKK